MKIEFQEEVRPKTYHYATIEGMRFDLYDLMNILEEVEASSGRSGGIRITNRKKCEHLKKIGVLATCGSQRWLMGAEPGPKFKEAYDIVFAEVYKEGR
ncbi:MAG: hypothetical protein ACXAEN_20265 [Candidatus Thorarchaeota archaeon]